MMMMMMKLFYFTELFYLCQWGHPEKINQHNTLLLISYIVFLASTHSLPMMSWEHIVQPIHPKKRILLKIQQTRKKKLALDATDKIRTKKNNNLNNLIEM